MDMDQGIAEPRITSAVADLSHTATTVLPSAIMDWREPRFEAPTPARLAGVAAKLCDRLRPALAEEEAHGHIFLWAPVALGLGSATWFSLAKPIGIEPMLVLAALAVALATLAGAGRPLGRRIALGLALTAGGMVLAAWETARRDTIILDSPVTTTITGTVIDRQADAEGRFRYRIEIGSTERPALRRPPRTALVTTLGDHEAFATGLTITGRARLSPPSGPALPGLNDFAFDAYFSGVGAYGFFYGSPEAATNGPATNGNSGWGTALSGALADLRLHVSARIRSVLPGDIGAFAASMVTDDRRAISKETSEALRLAGLAHIIAISGLNMALAAGLFFVGFRTILSLSQTIAHHLPVKRIAAVGALVTVTFYYLISGFAVSAERAYIMMVIMLVAVLFGRPSISLRNVALSAIIILVLSPSAVMGPGFQMSYAATLALVAGYAAWQRRGDRTSTFERIGPLRWLAPAWHVGAGIFVTSLIGGLSTAIFSIEHFHRIAAYGLPANLLAMPIISFIVMPAGLIALIAMPFGLDWLPLQVMGFGLDLVIRVAYWAASLGGDIVVGRIPAWFFIGITLGFLVLALIRTKLRLAGGGLVLACLGLFLLQPAPPRPELIVFEDGSLAGLITGGRISTNRMKPSDFIFDQWLRGLDLAAGPGPIVQNWRRETVTDSSDRQKKRRMTAEEISAARRVMQADIKAAPAHRFICRRRAWCAARLSNGNRVVVVENGALVGAGCDLADIVVTPARLAWSECRSGARLIGAESLRRSGSVEVYFDRDATGMAIIRIVAALASTDRAWQRHRLYDWRSGEFRAL